MPTPVQGQSAVLKIHDGTSLRDISLAVTDTGMNKMRDLAEISTIGGVGAKKYMPQQKDGTIPIEGFFDVTIDGYLAALEGDTTERAFEFYPGGTAVDQVKYTGNFFLSKNDIKANPGDATRFSSELQITGGWTRALVT